MMKIKKKLTAAALVVLMTGAGLPALGNFRILPDMAVTASAAVPTVTWDSEFIGNIDIRYGSSTNVVENNSDNIITVTPEIKKENDNIIFCKSVIFLQAHNNGECSLIFSSDSAKIKKIEIITTNGNYDITNLKSSGWTSAGNSVVWTGDSFSVDLTTESTNYIRDISSIVFTIEPAETHTLTYNANGGTGTVPAAASYVKGYPVTVPDGSGISKDRYYFKGWATSSTATEPGYTAESTFTMGDSDVTLYALWSDKPLITIPATEHGTVTAKVGGTAVTSRRRRSHP